MKLSPNAVRTLLSSVFPSAFIEDCTRFAVGGEPRSIADYRRTDNAATNQSIVASSFYDRFTENLHDLLSELLEHALDEVAVPHHVSPEFQATHDDASGAFSMESLEPFFIPLGSGKCGKRRAAALVRRGGFEPPLGPWQGPVIPLHHRRNVHSQLRVGIG